jgi:hypothetical protein
MIKTTLPHICDNTITILRGIEKAAKEILTREGKISCIIFLRECSGGYRVQQFMKAYWQASYQYPTLTDTWKTVSIGLADGKQWMEMLERGESVLDGLVR